MARITIELDTSDADILIDVVDAIEHVLGLSPVQSIVTSELHSYIVTQWDHRDEISGYLWDGQVYATENAAVEAGGTFAD